MGDTEGMGRAAVPASAGLSAVPVGDADRAKVIAVLRSACGDDRITLDQFAERAGIVYSAVTRAELDAVIRDLPASTAVTMTNPTGTRAPSRWIVGVMSGARRRGRWRVAPRTTAVAFWGGVKLDLRNAVVECPVVELRAWAIMGGVEVIVPDGIPVEMSGFVVMGGTTNRVKDMPALAGAPLVQVKARGMWGSVHVRSRPMGEPPRAHIEHHVQRALENAQRHADRAVQRADRLAERHRGSGFPGPSVSEATSRSADAGPLYAERPAEADFSSIVTDLREQPVDLTSQTAADGTVTILFSDIEGSTQLAERLGDHRWLDVVREHNRLIREQVAIAGGREIKAQGDGFMVTFPGTGRALRGAIEIQRALARWRENHPEAPVHVRIGIHTGEVLADGGDIYGKHVMIAARIASQARGGEVLASSLVRELADGAGFAFGAGRDVELRGLERPWRLYPVDWIED